MELEKEFDLEIPDGALRSLRTVGDLYLYVEQLAAATGRITLTGRCEGEFWVRYLTVVERELGITRDRLRPDAEFVRDLGVS